MRLSMRSLASRHQSVLPLAILGVIAAVIVVELPGALVDVGHRTRNAQATALEVRLLEGASGPGISTAYMLAAKREIPAGSRYAVKTGAAAAAPTRVTLQWVTTFSRFWLFPSRQVPLGSADWVLCYGCDRSQLPPGRVVYEEEGGALSIVRVGTS
jgi:hypothetical protein